MPTYHSLSDDDLITLLKDGKTAAFSEIYNRYAAALVNFASTKLFSLDDSRDVIQDVFVNLWTDREKLSINSSLKSFLFAAVRYKIVDKIRKNVTREEYALVIQSLKEYPSFDPQKELDAKELKEIVDKAILSLPPRIREIYELSRNQHQTIAEIAEKLHLSDQTVKNQLGTAMKLLKEKLSKLSVMLL